MSIYRDLSPEQNTHTIAMDDGSCNKRRRLLTPDDCPPDDCPPDDCPPPHLICPICMDAFDSAVYQCKVGHVLCSKCYYKLQSPKKCSYCTIPLEGIRNKIVEELAADLIVKCKWRGCDHVCKQGDMQKHVADCSHRGSQCHYLFCTWKGYEDQVQDHWKTVHNEEEVVCSDGCFEFGLYHEFDMVAETRNILINCKGRFYNLYFHRHDYHVAFLHVKMFGEEKLSTTCGSDVPTFTLTLKDKHWSVQMKSPVYVHGEEERELLFFWGKHRHARGVLEFH
jgi:hypothetical protein